jgi:outer membrane protein assembly factor BamE (lipoprotein component of BamABCDE complex)
MRLKLKPLTTQWLLAASFALGMASASASSGYTVRHEQELQITPGMSADEVRQALGRPARNVQYRNEPGPTWTYRVASSYWRAVFDIEFGADGKVASVGEHTDPDRD